MNEKTRSTVLFLVDGLRPGSLGPYGNTWFDTNCINQLASESLLFEQCISDTPDVQLGVRGIFSGQHCCDTENRRSNLVDVVGISDTDTVLITGDAVKFPDCQDMFDRVVEVPPPDFEQLPTEMAATHMAVFFAAVVETVRQIERPVFLVLDSPGFVKFWDAPYSIRENLADEDDPAPGNAVAAPGFQFNAASDNPDVLLDSQIAYGAQVVMFDQMLGIAIQGILESEWGSQALICLTSMRAFPLGEHGVVGFYRPMLSSESIHVPMIIRWPQDQRIVGRSHQLIQPGSLNSLLEKWHGIENDSDAESEATFPIISETAVLPDKQTAAVISKSNFEGEDFYSFQTNSWKYVSGPACQLFVKPDDIWDFNNVAELCPQIASDLHKQLLAGLAGLSQGIRPEFQLANELAFGFD